MKAAGLFLLALALVLAAASPAPAAEKPWQQLPALESLPEPMESGHADAKGVRIWYAVYGRSDAQTVTLLHGGLAHSGYWASLVRALAADFRVVVIDSRGHGRSGYDGGAFSYERMAGDVIAVLDRLSIVQTAIVGWSDGANAGIVLALKYPARVSALVAFGGNANPSGMQRARDRRAFDAYLARAAADYRRLSPQPRRYADVQRGLARLWRTQPALSAADLARINAPSLVIAAAHDEIVRLDHARWIAQSIPRAEFVLLQNAGHFAMLQDADTFNAAVLRFLTRR